MNHDLHKVLAEEVSLLVGEGVQHDLHKVLAEEVSHSASGEGVQHDLHKVLAEEVSHSASGEGPGCSMTFTKCWLRR